MDDWKNPWLDQTSQRGGTAVISGLAYSSHQVSDLDRARAFYQGLLGLKSQGSYAGTWEEYDVNGETFAVWKASEITPDYFRKLKVTGAIAFEVDDIERLCKKLKKAGVTFLQEPVNNGDHCITAYLKDPDGNIVTLHQLLEEE
jgi:catechol 2,3-dioxygenase-like lactoylglutathione lyase family enzyme